MIVVGCGESKLDRPAPARELYTGSVFRAARGYAEARQRTDGSRWLILSAAHGITEPGAVVAPYEQRLSLKGAELRVWAEAIARKLESALVRKRGLSEIEILAGADYAAPIARVLTGWGWSVIQPLAGLGTGHRIQWLVNARRRLESGA